MKEGPFRIGFSGMFELNLVPNFHGTVLPVLVNRLKKQNWHLVQLEQGFVWRRRIRRIHLCTILEYYVPFVRFRNPAFHTSQDSGSFSHFYFTIYIQCLYILSAVKSPGFGTNPRFGRELEQGYAEIMHRWLTKNTRSNTPRLTISWRLISFFNKRQEKRSGLKNVTSEKNRNHLQLHFRVSKISTCVSGFHKKMGGSFHLCQVTKHEPPRHSNQGTHLANSPCRFPEWSHNPRSSEGHPPKSQRRVVRWGEVRWY